MVIKKTALGLLICASPFLVLESVFHSFCAGKTPLLIKNVKKSASKYGLFK